MSLARALTSATKRMRPAQDPNAPQGSTSPNRSFSTRRNYAAYEAFDRNQISLPIELLSTTNPLAYDAPDLKDINIRDFQHLATSIPSPSPSSTTSYISDSDSAGFSSGASSASSVTTPSLSRESSPTATDSFFCEDVPSLASPAPVQTKQTVVVPPPVIPESDESAAPEIPKRALSHTKKTHEVLARKRSTSRMRSPPGSTSLSPGTMSPIRTSFDIFNPSVPASNSDNDSASSHPFGAELAQVNELVEEITSPASTNFSPISPALAIAPPMTLRDKTSNSDLRSPRSPRRPMMRAPAVSERGAMVDVAHQQQQQSEKLAGMEREVHVVADDEERFVLEKGLARWGVEAYLQEIEELYSSRWETEENVAGGWF